MPVTKPDNLTRFQRLQSEHYNATITTFRRVTDSLAIIRIMPDAKPSAFIAGQYTVLGIGYWEPRIPTAQREHSINEKQLHRVARRAYSVSCPILDDGGNVMTVARDPELEFYIALVSRSDTHAPVLTPRLFALGEGARLYVGPRFHGRYTLKGVEPDDDVAFLSTGTGEAPHNAMLAELLSRGHRGRIVSVVCTRHRADLGYVATHRRVEAQFTNYTYLPLTTRERENTDASAPGYVGKRYVQDYFASGEMERDAGFGFHPERTHFFLCGNPAMISSPKADEPRSGGMVEALLARGFEVDRPRHPGNVHCEKYW